MLQSRAECASIDLCKFFMAIVVIAIHVHPFEGYSRTTLLDMYGLLCGCAVPFFFMCTGYFIAQKVLYTSYEQQFTVLKRYVKKLLYLYLFWTVVYLPLTVFGYCNNTAPWWKDVIYFIHGLVVMGEHYNSWILWYLLSGIYGLLFIYFFRKKDVSWENIVLIGLVLYLCGAAITEFVKIDGGLPAYIMWLQKIISAIVSGRIFTSFFFIPMGVLIYKIEADKWQAWGCIFAAIVLWCFGGNEIPVISTGIIALGAIGIFAFVINIHLAYKDIYRYMRTSSTVLYFLHMWIWTLVYSAIYGKKVYGMDMFVFTLLVTLGISLVYIFYKKEKATVQRP